MAKSVSDRVLATPSSYAKSHYLYVQEIGTLTSMEPHISSRENLSSYLFLAVRKGEGYLTYRGKGISSRPGTASISTAGTSTRTRARQSIPGP